MKNQEHTPQTVHITPAIMATIVFIPYLAFALCKTVWDSTKHLIVLWTSGPNELIEVLRQFHHKRLEGLDRLEKNFQKIIDDHTPKE